ncbi:MAG: T9SS type A sorting domain-containing protein, partial [Gammaproteobacteria bacterium]
AQNNGQNTRYTFPDANVSSGINYYRLKIVDRSAGARYSAIVKVDLAGKVGGVTVYPNPAAQKQITLQLSDMEKGTYQLEIYNGAGQPVYRQSIQHNGGSLSRGFALSPSFTAGAYFVKIRGEKTTYDQLLILK